MPKVGISPSRQHRYLPNRIASVAKFPRIDHQGGYLGTVTRRCLPIAITDNLGLDEKDYPNWLRRPWRAFETSYISNISVSN